jgi:hypothetical protein
MLDWSWVEEQRCVRPTVIKTLSPVSRMLRIAIGIVQLLHCDIFMNVMPF